MINLSNFSNTFGLYEQFLFGKYIHQIVLVMTHGLGFVSLCV